MDRIPDHVLFQIFDYLSVREVISTVPRVCKRWFALRHSACLHRRSLALMVTNEDGLVESKKRISFYSDSGNPRLETFTEKAQGKVVADQVGVVSFDQSPLKLNLLTKMGVSQLLTSFANIHTLEVSIGDLNEEEDILNQFFRLLNGFSAKLITLKLVITLYLRSEESLDLPRFVGCLNHLPHLRRLTLQIHNDHHLGWMEQYLQQQRAGLSLSVLGQLIEFNYYCSHSSIDGIVDALNRYAVTNQRLQTVCLAIDLEENNIVSLSRKIPKSLARKFRFLSFHLSRSISSWTSLGYSDYIDAVCDALTDFVQITSLSLWLQDNKLILDHRRFVRLLEPVKERLTHLRLTFDLGDFYEFDRFPDEYDDEEDELAQDHCYFPSLRVLALNIIPYSLVFLPKLDALDSLAKVFSTVDRVRLYLEDVQEGDVKEVMPEVVKIVKHLVESFPKRVQIYCEPNYLFSEIDND